MSSDSRPDFDVIVIGGGAAGLSGAVALARSRRRVAVIDSGRPRNAPAGHVHNYLGRESTPPGELLAAGRAELAGYGGTVIDGTVTDAVRDPDHDTFVVELAGGDRHTARRLLVAAGAVDELPDIPGVREGWGSSVLHCPYCHGWEVRDRPIGVLATGSAAVHQALLFRQLSDDVVLFRNGADLDRDQVEQLAARGIAVIDGAVAALESVDAGVTGVRLRTGAVFLRHVVVVAGRVEARAGFLASLGLRPEPVELHGVRIGSRIPVDGTGATAVPGVWAAGNVTEPNAQVMASAAAGLRAGAVINADLINAETAAAVAAARSRSAA